MYKDFFDLKERPFSISPDPRYIYLTDQHQEALAKCQYSIAQKMGISIIYGDIGAGKTSLARTLWTKYSADGGFNFAMLVHPNYPSPFQLIREIRREFGQIKPRRSLADELNDLQGFLIQSHQEGKTNILVIDEAQRLKTPLFELLRQLLNFETNTEKLLQSVLFGQNELATKIDRLPAFKDRVTIFGALSSLTRKDTDAMINFRWKVAGGDKHPFEPEALNAIFRRSKGLPRRICKLCDNALIRIFSAGKKTVDENTIEAVAEELRLIPDQKEKFEAKKQKKEQKNK